MASDSRIINPDKVIELLEQKLDSKRLEIFYLRLRESDNSTTFLFVIRVFAILFDYTFKYNDSKGIATEELIANKVYSGFMEQWIAYPKVTETIKESKEFEKVEE